MIRKLFKTAQLARLFGLSKHTLRLNPKCNPNKYEKTVVKMENVVKCVLIQDGYLPVDNEDCEEMIRKGECKFNCDI